MKRALVVGVVVLLSGVAAAGVFGGGSGGAAAAVVDVLAELVGKNVNANSYTANNTSGPGFQSTGDRVDAVRLGTGPRATIGTCNGGAICLGPNSGSDTGVYVSGFIVARSQQIQGELDLLGDNAYLRNNNGAVRVNDADGFVINGTSPLKGIDRATATVDFPAIPNNDCVSITTAVAGAQVHDFVDALADFDLPDDVTVRAEYVVSAGQVKLKACNHSNEAAEDPSSGSFIIRMER